MPPSPPTIGVFDSGFGGFTVLRALLTELPGTHFVYLGDTARLPYGAKSQATIARYAVEAARFLVGQGARMLVIACNTATALALADIRAAVNVPVVGVIRPGAEAAQAALQSPAASHILVLATAATVHSHAYRDICATLGLHATEMPCPLLVPLVEEGWIDHPVTRDVLRIYLTDALSRVTPAAVVLGCTHYPLLAPLIGETLLQFGCHAPIVDSAKATAQTTAQIARTLWTPNPNAAHPATFTCYATDSIEKFAQLGSHFLDQPIPQVHLLDLGG